MTSTPMQVYQRLLDELGPQHWWPGDSPLEVMVGAVLVQNTTWKNVERAIDNLRNADLLDLRRLAATASTELADLIRPAGYFRLKEKRLRCLLEFVVRQYDGSIQTMRCADTHRLRQELLAVHGIGPETADSILLYALEKPVMVVDTYTHRVFARHGWIGYDTDYYQLQGYLADEIPQEISIYNELHALLVNVGHHYCRKTPQCEECPLREMLPDRGVVLAESEH